MFDLLESTITTYLEYKVRNKLGTKYPDLNFITEPQDDTDYKFPCVYVNELAMTETANTLSHKSINAVDYSIQIQVSSNKKKSISKEVAYAITDILHNDLGFRITTMPLYMKQATIHTYNLRANRLVGSGDKI